MITDLLAGLRKEVGRLARAGFLTLFIGGKPVPAGRPRVGRFGTYYPAPYTRWMKASANAVETLDDLPSDRPIAVFVEAVCERPKTTKSCAPMGDVDNFAKGPLDLLTKSKRAWLDDRQVVILVTAKRWANDGEEVGFNIQWCELKGQL